MTKDDAPPVENTKHRPSMAELGKKLDAALRDADAKQTAVDVAKTALAAATTDHAAAVQVISTLKQQYDELMKDVLSFGGTVHVAQ